MSSNYLQWVNQQTWGGWKKHYNKKSPKSAYIQFPRQSGYRYNVGKTFARNKLLKVVRKEKYRQAYSKCRRVMKKAQHLRPLPDSVKATSDVIPNATMIPTKGWVAIWDSNAAQTNIKSFREADLRGISKHLIKLYQRASSKGQTANIQSVDSKGKMRDARDFEEKIKKLSPAQQAAVIDPSTNDSISTLNSFLNSDMSSRSGTSLIWSANKRRLNFSDIMEGLETYEEAMQARQ